MTRTGLPPPALSGLEAVNQKGNTVVVLNNLSESIWPRENSRSLPLPSGPWHCRAKRDGNSNSGLRSRLGYSQLGLGQPAEARQAFAEAISIMEKLRMQTAGGAEERQRYFENRLSAHHGMLNLLVKENQTQEALFFAERTKARMLLDVLQQGRVNIQKAMTVEEQQQEGRLKLELTRFNTQLTRAKESGKPEPKLLSELTPRLEKARLNYEAFLTALYSAHPELKIHRGEGPIIRRKNSLRCCQMPPARCWVCRSDEVTYLLLYQAPANRKPKCNYSPYPIKRAS